MKTGDVEQLWKDPKNWKFGIFYSCKDDPRIWVPKRREWMGITLNFGHPARAWCEFALVTSAALFPGSILLWAILSGEIKTLIGLYVLFPLILTFLCGLRKKLREPGEPRSNH